MAFNLALKVAIIESRKSQTVIAAKAGIHESRFSKIVHGHLPASEDEQKTIARVLRRNVAELFPPSEAMAS